MRFSFPTFLPRAREQGATRDSLLKMEIHSIKAEIIEIDIEIAEIETKITEKDAAIAEVDTNTNG